MMNRWGCRSQVVLSRLSNCCCCRRRRHRPPTTRVGRLGRSQETEAQPVMPYVARPNCTDDLGTCVVAQAIDFAPGQVSFRFWCGLSMCEAMVSKDGGARSSSWSDGL